MKDAKEMAVIVAINVIKEQEEREAIEKERQERERERKAELEKFCNKIIEPILIKSTSNIVHTNWFTRHQETEVGYYNDYYKTYCGKKVSVLCNFYYLRYNDIKNYLESFGYEVTLEPKKIWTTTWYGNNGGYEEYNELVIKIF